MLKPEDRKSLQGMMYYMGALVDFARFSLERGMEDTTNDVKDALKFYEKNADQLRIILCGDKDGER